jgi:large subunit ribosomal protein L35
MPKIKTNRSAAKRFKRTGAGHLRRRKAYASHFFTKKTSRRKRALRQPALVHAADSKRMERLLPS